jgi:hypothetical protein
MPGGRQAGGDYGKRVAAAGAATGDRANPSGGLQFEGIRAEKEIPDKTYEHIDNAE